MTIEDLRERGVLLPREEWGAHHLQSTVPTWRLAAALALASLSLVAAILGDGGRATWAGTGAFLLCFLWITWICDRAVRRQRRRVREEREALGRGRRGSAGAGA